MEPRADIKNNPNPPVGQPVEKKYAGTEAKPLSQEKKESLTHKAGDAIERAGEKLQEMGAKKVGQAVYKAGNKLEHSQDDKEDKH